MQCSKKPNSFKYGFYIQQARQILDIIVGFKISPELWKSISWNSKAGLSAGRCQNY